jgi:predicted Zn-dependent protease
MRLARYAFPALCAAVAGGCALSVQQELEIGQQYAAQLDRELPIVRDPAIQADLDLIAARLTPHSSRPEITYRFRLVNSAAVNAFAVPGGYIYVTRALIDNMTSLDQLAGVLGHEIGHVEHRHSAKQLGRARAAQIGVGVTEVLTAGSRGGGLATAGANITGSLVLARYSRAQEEESDATAVRLATLARINPDGIVEFFRTLQRVEGSRPGALESFFASHPMTDDRIAATTALIAASPEASALRTSGEHDAPEFRRLKAAMARLPAPPDAPPQRRQ